MVFSPSLVKRAGILKKKEFVKERLSHESRESHQGDKTVLDTDAHKNRSLHDIKNTTQI